MYQVLLPIDEDPDRARAQAETVARFPSAEIGVTLLHVADAPNDEPEIGDVESARRAREILTGTEIEVDEQLRVGKPAEEILAEADRIGADQIVLGGRKRSPLGSLLFGSVSQAVLLDSTRPVTITGDETAPEPSHVCGTCGERYYTNDEVSIATCRQCGGVKVERAS